MGDERRNSVTHGHGITLVPFLLQGSHGAPPECSSSVISAGQCTFVSSASSVVDVEENDQDVRRRLEFGGPRRI
jgi:hypothetical protein